ncbi:MAG TPA: WD40 repeat domain-containing protein, partial [Tepidisphaeraceae bacterium]|nr:WD40 repeat domain-containing protein [Tepidisphaeraceae bacterium]
LKRRYYFKGPGEDPKHTLGNVAFSPDGKLIANGAAHNKIIIRETESGRVVNELGPEGHRVWCVRFSPDGRTLATATVDSASRTQIWDLSRDKPLATFEPGAFSLAYSADGRLLAAGGAATISIYDTHSFKLLRSFRAHNEDIWGIAFSPDGRTLATASYDKTLRLWCVSNGELLLTYPLEGIVWAVAFSPDGRTIAANTSAGTHFFDSADPKAADEGPDGMRHRWHALFAAGKADDAEQELRKSIDGYKQREGADSVIAAHLTTELGSLLVSRRDPSRYVQAERLVSDARSVLIKNLPPGHVWRHRANAILRELYGPEAMNNASKLSEIEAALVARPATAPTIPEPGKWTIADLDPINVEAWKLRRDGKIEESAALREFVVAEAKRLLPPDDIRLFKYLLGYGDVLTLLKRFEKAAAQYDQASTILERQSTPSSQDKALLTASVNSLRKATGAAATQPTIAASAPTTSRATTASAEQLLAWDRLSPEGVARAVEAALAADEATAAWSPLDRLIYGEHLILAGKPQRAAAAIRQAINELSKQGAVPSFYYKSLGWALLACGQSEQATAALCVALRDEKGWTSSTQPADADRDQWIAALLSSRITQQQYTARWSDPAAACFSWFYVGQLMEIQGKRAAAIAAYQKAVSSGAHQTGNWAAYRLQLLGALNESPTTRADSSSN